MHVPFFVATEILIDTKTSFAQIQNQKCVKNQFLSSYLELEIFFCLIKYVEFLDASSGAFSLIHFITSPSKSTYYQKPVFSPRNWTFF